MLNMDRFSDREIIREGLKQPFLVIRDALLPEVAEKAYEELVAYPQWQYQDHRNDLRPGEQAIQDKLTPGYTFSRDKITLGADQAPETVSRVYEHLCSPEILSYFSAVSGRPCDDFQLSATMFRSGHHIADHNDFYVTKRKDGATVTRALTFNYYLTKHWQPEWGGRFVWKKPHTEIIPSFNTLVLFLVGKMSHHYVEAVKAEAAAPRIALTGWYLSVRKPGAGMQSLPG